MTTSSEEVWALLRELTEAQKRAQQEIDRRAQEAERRAQEAERRAQEAERRAQDRAQETERMAQETERKMRETDRQIKELGKQIGGLGEKFGSFTEGLALPSMERLLRERFGMEVISPSVRITKGGRHLEIDVLAYANGPINAAYVVEVKSHLREEGITQLRDLLQRFREFLPEHRDKRLYGILAAVDLTPALRERVLHEGFYVARIQDQVFTLDVPEGFEPRVY
jgi:hypothetical protein